MVTHIGTARAAMIAAGGLAAVLGLYWDDAWHTDVGRDTFFSPPHVLLYAGVTALLAAAVAWAWQRGRDEGWAVLRDPVVALPLAGAAITLVAAPVDEVWHQLFGRDAVVWSPPHMVAVAGLLAFAAGLFLAVQQGRSRPHPLVGATIGAFLIAATVTVGMEFETDVPQFPVVTYLPVAVGALTLAFALLHRGSGRPWIATQAAAVYLGLRVAVVGFLALLGHSLPTVMPTIVAAWAFDWAVRRSGRRWVIAAATAAATVGAYVPAHAVQGPGLGFTAAEVLVGAVAGVVVARAVLAAAGVGRRAAGVANRRVAAAAMLALVGLVPAAPAFAHDPGQGEEVASVTLAAARHGERIELEVVGEVGSCRHWEPRQVLARRAGRTYVGPLVPVDGCRFEGAVDVDSEGRWFVYAEVLIAGALTETWLPVEDAAVTKDTVLYRAPAAGTPLGQVVAGVVLYALVAAILVAIVLAYRRRGAPAAASPRERTPVSGSGSAT